ncbi:hypothetical protein RG959_20280 [Domibacillus sp. 8LH]|uniref:hypothetical protein n=1 Tax=Domibacillus sp. 8LH TaxID=3073900 RepID=UPI003174A93C
MLMDVPKIKSAQDMAGLAAEIERMESSLKVLKSELKRFVDQNGAVDTADKVWTYNVAVSWEFHESGLRNMADQLAVKGINPWKVTMISAVNLKKSAGVKRCCANLDKKREETLFVSKQINRGK